jgi:F-type H+-transporting ATPase subunit b
MRNLVLVSVAFIAMALWADPAFAVDEKKEAQSGKIDVADKFGLKRYDLGIYTLIVFGLLVFVLGRFAWGPMMRGLDKREETIRKAHEDAENARAEAEKVLAEVQARLARTHEEIRAMLDEARRDAQGVKDQMRADAAAEIQAERNRIRREIEIARDDALKEIYEQSVQLAAIMSTKAIQRELSPSDHNRLLDDAVRDLRRNLGRPTLDA